MAFCGVLLFPKRRLFKPNPSRINSLVLFKIISWRLNFLGRQAPVRHHIFQELDTNTGNCTAGCHTATALMLIWWPVAASFASFFHQPLSITSKGSFTPIQGFTETAVEIKNIGFSFGAESTGNDVVLLPDLVSCCSKVCALKGRRELFSRTFVWHLWRQVFQIRVRKRESIK